VTFEPQRITMRYLDESRLALFEAVAVRRSCETINSIIISSWFDIRNSLPVQPQ
jgi:hypothetical protein